MFQATKADKEDTRKLVHSINRSILDEPLSESVVETSFESLWPLLEKELAALPPPDTIVETKRTTDDMLAEVLEFTRSEINRRKKTERLDQYAPIFEEFMPLLAQVVKAAKANPLAFLPSKGLQLSRPKRQNPSSS